MELVYYRRRDEEDIESLGTVDCSEQIILPPRVPIYRRTVVVPINRSRSEPRRSTSALN